MPEKIDRATFLEGRELLKCLRARFPILFPANRRDIKPWLMLRTARRFPMYQPVLGLRRPGGRGVST